MRPRLTALGGASLLPTWLARPRHQVWLRSVACEACPPVSQRVRPALTGSAVATALCCRVLTGQCRRARRSTGRPSEHRVSQRRRSPHPAGGAVRAVGASPTAHHQRRGQALDAATPVRVPHAHSPCAAHPEPARRQRRATCAHPWTVLTRPCDRRTGAPMFPGADGDRGPPGWPPREAALHDSPPPLREPALRERRRCMSQHCRCPSAPGAQSVVLLSGRHEARASVLEQRRVSCVENGVGLGHAVVRVS